MEIKIISEEYMKPSSPTPKHLRHLQFSFLDQLHPNVFVPLIHFYPKNSTFNNSQRLKLLKKSLSETLTILYPVAGRLNNSHIDCNDQGLLLVEAKANCQLSDVLRDLNPNNSTYFIPSRLDDLAGFSQITIFNCGGIAVSFAISHKLGDFLSSINFLVSWAAIARRITNASNDVNDIIVPPFGSAKYFPPLDVFQADNNVLIAKEKLVAKAFLFDRAAIEHLKARCTAVNGKKLSRVEVLTDFICSRFMDTTEEKNKKYRVTQAVNLRTRMDPPLPMLTFGNYSIPEQVKPDSTRKVNAEFIKKLGNKDEQINFLKSIYEEFSNEDVVSFSCTSPINLPFHETDFGWGKPLWTTTTPTTTKNVIVLVPAKDGLGIEAWVTSKEEDMAKFEIDNELLRYVSTQTLELDAHSRL